MMAEILDAVLLAIGATIYVVFIGFLIWMGCHCTKIYRTERIWRSDQLEHDPSVLGMAIFSFFGAAFFILLGLDIVATNMGW